MTTIRIVGAGLTGASIAYFLRQKQIPCEIYEKNESMGGMCRSFLQEGRRIDFFGPHIFHTSNEEAWKVITENCQIEPIIHRVKAIHNGQEYTLPINKTTLNEMFGDEVFTTERMKILEDIFIKSYTEKQWLTEYSKVDKSIVKRLIIRDSYNDSYFDDEFVGKATNGSDELIQNLIGETPVHFGERCVIQNDSEDIVVWTGRIDEGFEYKHGEIEFLGRVFSFKKEPWLYNVDVLNFPDKEQYYIRKTRYGDITCEETSVTGNKENAFYYIPTESNHELFMKYRAELPPNYILAGRLAENKYYDMDDCIIRGQEVAEEIGKKI